MRSNVVKHMPTSSLAACVMDGIIKLKDLPPKQVMDLRDALNTFESAFRHHFQNECSGECDTCAYKVDTGKYTQFGDGGDSIYRCGLEEDARWLRNE